MIARLLISPSLNIRKNIIWEKLKENSFTKNHPDLLYIEEGEKLGIAEARKIKEHFSLRPYSAKGRIVVLEDVSEMTLEAQNALLKTLEELPEESIFILGSASDANLLPTILSRCHVVILGNEVTPESGSRTKHNDRFTKDLEKLLNISVEERFRYVEKLKDREEFLHQMVNHFRQQLLNSKGSSIEIKNFLKELLQAEKWAKQNVNIRGILEYLMLVMPQKI